MAIILKNSTISLDNFEDKFSKFDARLTKGSLTTNNNNAPFRIPHSIEES
jgi:hypothetical protein